MKSTHPYLSRFQLQDMALARLRLVCQVQILREANQLDMELFAYAKERSRQINLALHDQRNAR